VAIPRIPLLLATTNEGKAREIRAALKGLPFKVMTLADIGVKAAYPEKGTTFEANARGKSLHYSRKSAFLTLAEDSGLEVEALGGAPGVRSARFSAARATDLKNNLKLLRLLEGIPAPRRKARFVCCMTLSANGRTLKTVRGQVQGWIAEEPKGTLGFGYDPVFFFRPWRKTFGQIPPALKNTVSHRGRALARMKAFLAKG
jgi:XTP/dITP diphosphohydrolase